MDANSINQSLLDNLIALWPVILPFLGNTIASIICMLTKTPPKSGIWGKVIYPLIELVALNVVRAKQKPGEG